MILQSKFRPQAFTLLEMVIVLAVIAVLVGLLAPALPSNKAKRGQHKCVNNLKQVGMAFKGFASDNNDLMPWQVSTNAAYHDETRTWIHFQSL